MLIPVTDDLEQAKPGILRGIPDPTIHCALVYFEPVLRLRKIGGSGDVRVWNNEQGVWMLDTSAASETSTDGAGTSLWDRLTTGGDLNVSILGSQPGEVLLGLELTLRGTSVKVVMDVVKVGKADVDLDADTDNDSEGWPRVPSESAGEDAAEMVSPGLVIGVNNDHDEFLPGADPWDYDLENDTANPTVEGSNYGGHSVGLAKVKVKVSTMTGGQLSFDVPGSVRLFEENGGAFQGGRHLNPGNHTLTFYLEGVQETGGPVTLKAEFAPDGTTLTVDDEILLTPVLMDIDVDTDNGSVPGEEEEELPEAKPGVLGMIVPVTDVPAEGKPGILHGIAHTATVTAIAGRNPVITLKKVGGGGDVKVWKRHDPVENSVLMLNTAVAASTTTDGEGNSLWSILGPGNNDIDILVTGVKAGEVLLGMELTVNSCKVAMDVARVTVIQLDLDVDTDDDGQVEPEDDPTEMNAVGDDPPGPYVNLNNDDDDQNTTPDHDDTGPSDNENDLRVLPLTFLPDTLDKGEVTLVRSNSKVRIWSGSKKGADNKVLYDNDSKSWDLSQPGQRSAFNDLLTKPEKRLHAEGVELGECVVSVSYKNPPDHPLVLVEDEVRLTVCPGPPQEYPDWDTMSLIMAGGQLHSQWQHFSKLADQQPSKYKVYIDTSNQGENNPFANRTIPAGVTTKEIDPEVNPAETAGYTAKIDETPVGAFYIHYPARGDEDGTKYWVLVRSRDTTTGLESQKSLAYMVIVDYPDRKGAGDTTNRKDPTKLNFYVASAAETGDVFLYCKECPFCGNEVTDPAYVDRWRVDRAPRRNYNAGDTGSYYSAVKTDFTTLKGYMEGDDKVFDKTKDTFAVPGGGYTETDDDKFFVLVSPLFGDYGGYSWTDKDRSAPWPLDNQGHKVLSKSNYADMVYLQDTSDASLAVTSAHELQHNIHGNPECGDTNEKSWINEACSKLSEEENLPALAQYSMGGFATMAGGSFTHQGRYALCSLNRHNGIEVYLRWTPKCPFCRHDDADEWANALWHAHYKKAALWGHYLDKVIGPDNDLGYKVGDNIAKIVGDDANSITGINNHLKKALLTMQGTPPQCGFVNWTIANYCNQFDAVPAKYKYTGGWHDASHKPAVTPYTAAAARGSYEAANRQLRNLAADYIQYNHADGDAGTLVITLKHVSDSSLWTNLEVHAVRLKGGAYVDVQRLTTADEGDEREYELPGAWGTGGGDDYSKAVIIITDLTDTDEAAFKKTYNIMADTK